MVGGDGDEKGARCAWSLVMGTCGVAHCCRTKSGWEDLLVDGSDHRKSMVVDGNGLANYLESVTSW